MRYRIGEFARLAGVTIKTLRFYDALGLLRPAAVDPRTRYRFYDSSQLATLAAIGALQELGASLADIRRVITRADGEQARRRLLSRLRSNALRALETTQRSLEWIEVELQDVALREVRVPVVLKQRDAMDIASIRARLRTYADITPVERELGRSVPAPAGRACGVLWHRCEASGVIEGEPFVEVRGQVLRAAGVEIRQLPGARVASAYCAADDESAFRIYDALDRWIHRHSLRLAGPKRELYVGQILEVQFPVRPV